MCGALMIAKYSPWCRPTAAQGQQCPKEATRCSSTAQPGGSRLRPCIFCTVGSVPGLGNELLFFIRTTRILNPPCAHNCPNCGSGLKVMVHPPSAVTMVGADTDGRCV